MSSGELTGLAADIWHRLRNTYDPARILEVCKEVQALEVERDELRATLADMTRRVEQVNAELSGVKIGSKQ